MHFQEVFLSPHPYSCIGHVKLDSLGQIDVGQNLNFTHNLLEFFFVTLHRHTY